MRNPIALSLILAGLAGVLAAPRAEASCAFLRGPRHIEAEVVTCESPRARAEAAFAKHPMTYPQGGDSPARLGNILKSAPPSQVVSLKVIRFQQLPKDAEGAGEDLAGVPWTKEEKPEIQEYLVTGVASCAEFPPGEKARFFERFTCCDTLPYTDLQCLVGLPVLVPAEAARRGE